MLLKFVGKPRFHIGEIVGIWRAELSGNQICIDATDELGPNLRAEIINCDCAELPAAAGYLCFDVYCVAINGFGSIAHKMSGSDLTKWSEFVGMKLRDEI